MKVSQLDPAKTSSKFKRNNLPDNDFVYVKCDKSGNIEYRGSNQEYRLYDVRSHKLTKLCAFKTFLKALIQAQPGV